MVRSAAQRCGRGIGSRLFQFQASVLLVVLKVMR